MDGVTWMLFSIVVVVHNPVVYEHDARLYVNIYVK